MTLKTSRPQDANARVSRVKVAQKMLSNDSPLFHLVLIGHVLHLVSLPIKKFLDQFAAQQGVRMQESGKLILCFQGPEQMLWFLKHI